MTQFKLIKVRLTTYKELTTLIKKVEKEQPYLKGLIGYNVMIQMLLLKNRIKLSKYRHLKRVG